MIKVIYLCVCSIGALVGVLFLVKNSYLFNRHLLKLRRLGVYGKFKRNLIAKGKNFKDFTKMYSAYPFSGFILRAFVFKSTPEGHSFWMNIMNM